MSHLYYVLPGYFLGLVAGIIYFKHLPKSYRLVLALLVIAVFCDCYGYYIVAHLKKWNTWVFNIYILIEIWLMGMAAVFLVSQRKVRLVFLSLLLINTIIWATEVALKSIYQLSNLTLVAYSVSLTAIFIVVLFNNSLFTQKSILKLPVFWLAASTILYFSCMVPYFGLSSFLIRTSPTLAHKLYWINTFLNVVRYPLVAVSFILLGREGRTSSRLAHRE